jgi:hypothetical protein
VPFKKGQGGRPKGASNKTTLEEKQYWREFFESETYRVTLKARILDGKAPHMEKHLHEKTFGKPTEHVEISGNDQRPVRVVHEYHAA